MRVPRRTTADARTAASVGSPAEAGCWLSRCTCGQPRSRCNGTSSGASGSSVGSAAPCTASTSLTWANRRHGSGAPGRGDHSKPGASSALNSSYAAPRAIASAR